MIMIDFSKIVQGKKNVLLIRHAERYAFKDGQLGNDVSITDNGITTAVNFGKSLRDKGLVKIFTSPVKRCVQTAERIKEGLADDVQIVESQALGMPSTYIENDKIAGKYLTKTDFYNGYLSYVNGGKRPGFYSLSEGSERLETFLKSTSCDKKLTLYISHDSIVSFFIFYKTKYVFTRENWLNFLDGILLNYD